MIAAPFFPQTEGKKKKGIKATGTHPIYKSSHFQLASVLEQAIGRFSVLYCTLGNIFYQYI